MQTKSVRDMFTQNMIDTRYSL